MGEAKWTAAFIVVSWLTTLALGSVRRIGPHPQAEFKLDVSMPGLSPPSEDAYMCFRVAIPNAGYVVKFVPVASADRVHHMLMFGCDGEPTNKANPWDCGHHGVCPKGSRQQILYAWAKNAPPLELPADVGVAVGKDAGGPAYIVLQVHYSHRFIGDVLDYSGVQLEMSSQQPVYLGSIYLFASMAGPIPQGVESFKMNMSCSFDTDVPVYPFGFRTHAHKLGQTVSAFVRRDDKWLLIGKGNPQWPQMFYPVQDKSLEIRPNEVVAAQCNYKGGDVDTYIGNTGHDEMCNFYMYYYRNASSTAQDDGCYTDYKKVFDAYPVVKPSDLPAMPEWEEKAKGMDQPFEDLNTQSIDVTLDGHSAKKRGYESVPYQGGRYALLPSRTGGYGPYGDFTNDRKKAGQNLFPQQRIGNGYYPAQQQIAGGYGQPPDNFQQNSPDYGYGQQTQADSDPTNGQSQVQIPRTGSLDQFVTYSGNTGDKEVSGVSEMVNWPNAKGAQFGDIAGVTVDLDGNVVIFHRGPNVWNANSFSSDNLYQQSELGAIPVDTIAVINSSRSVIKQFGSKLFFMPHGVFVDSNGNFWMTDVALHQVFKFTPTGTNSPAMTLGERFVPGNDDTHFCKPAAVHVTTDDFIYVGDGYCNSRILKFNAKGELLMSWGQASYQTNMDVAPPLGSFSIVHSIAVDETRQQMYIADRQNGRLQILDLRNGTFISQYSAPVIGSSLYAVAFCPDSDTVFLANGNQGPTVLRVFAVNPVNWEMMYSWKPSKPVSFTQPHSLAVSRDGYSVYLGDLGSSEIRSRLWGFKLAFSKRKPTGTAAVDSKKLPTVSSLPTDVLTRSPLVLAFILLAAISVPILIGVLVCVCIRFRKQGGFRAFNIGAGNRKKPYTAKNGVANGKNGTIPLLNGWNKSHKGFQPLRTEDIDAMDDLSDESDNDDTLYPLTKHTTTTTA